MAPELRSGSLSRPHGWPGQPAWNLPVQAVATEAGIVQLRAQNRSAVGLRAAKGFWTVPMRIGNAARAQHFELLVLPHLESIYRTAYHLVGRDEAEDLTQETYLRAWQSFDQFRGPNPAPWLFAILRNCFLDGCRRRQREPQTISLEPETFMDVCAPSAEQVTLDARLNGEVQSALMALPDEWRLILLLADIEDLTYREIAAVMQIPVGTVMSRICRARRRLYDCLADYARRNGYPVEEAR
jgi:RNA polymerase sigma-70 factor, ECF subfamily